MLRTAFRSNDGTAVGPAGTGQPVSARTLWSSEGPLSSRESPSWYTQEGHRVGDSRSSGSQVHHRQVQPKRQRPG